MHHRHREQCVDVYRETLPTDDQAAVLALEPRQRPLGLEARDVLLHGAPTPLAIFPDALRDLGAHPTVTKAPAKACGIIPLIRCQHLESFARSAPFACA